MSKRPALISLTLSACLVLLLSAWQPWTPPKVIKAFGPLVVQFSQNPLFVVNNWLPGDSDSQSFTVENQDSQTRQLAVRADNIIGPLPADYSQQIMIEFVHNNQTIYQASLADFFAQPFVLLGTLAPAENKTWGTSVAFLPTAGNDFQQATVTFDLIFMEQIVGPGGETIPPECEQISFSGPPIIGTPGRDRLRGTLGNDLIWGLAGDDRILGSGGDDCIIAGEGNDRVYGGTGKDFIWGDQGDDYINAGSDEDHVWGGAGDDYIRSGSDPDQVWGEAGNDRIDGGSGNDQLLGGEGDDRIAGGSGNDLIQGQAGNDYMTGGSGTDQLVGGSETDFANGQTGTDECSAETEIRCEL